MVARARTEQICVRSRRTGKPVCTTRVIPSPRRMRLQAAVRCEETRVELGFKDTPKLHYDPTQKQGAQFSSKTQKNAVNQLVCTKELIIRQNI